MSPQSLSMIPQQPGFDPWSHPELYEGITVKRIFAYAIDIIVVMFLGAVVWMATGLLGLMSLGLLLPLQPLAVALVPLAYHTLLIAGPRCATLGMRVMSIQVVSINADPRPSLAQAAIQTVCFYGSIAMTASIILVFALFNSRRRTLHDILAGTVVLNRKNVL